MCLSIVSRNIKNALFRPVFLSRFSVPFCCPIFLSLLLPHFSVPFCCPISQYRMAAPFCYSVSLSCFLSSLPSLLVARFPCPISRSHSAFPISISCSFNIFILFGSEWFEITCPLEGIICNFFFTCLSALCKTNRTQSIKYGTT